MNPFWVGFIIGFVACLLVNVSLAILLITSPWRRRKGKDQEELLDDIINGYKREDDEGRSG